MSLPVPFNFLEQANTKASPGSFECDILDQEMIPTNELNRLKLHPPNDTPRDDNPLLESITPLGYYSGGLVWKAYTTQTPHPFHTRLPSMNTRRKSNMGPLLFVAVAGALADMEVGMARGSGLPFRFCGPQAVRKCGSVNEGWDKAPNEI